MLNADIFDTYEYFQYQAGFFDGQTDVIAYYKAKLMFDAHNVCGTEEYMLGYNDGIKYAYSMLSNNATNIENINLEQSIAQNAYWERIEGLKLNR